MSTKAKSLLMTLVISVMLLSLVSCDLIPQQPGVTTQAEPKDGASFQRKMTTAAYSGGPAVIFRLDDVAKGQTEEVVERIIRLFGKNAAPLDVSVVPHADGRDSFNMPFLREYLDVGVIDISMNGNRHSATEFDTVRSGTSYDKLKSDLTTARNQFQQYFGVTPVAIALPYDNFDEGGYRAVLDAGFKVFSVSRAVDSYPSVQPVDYYGNWSKNGMSRMSTVSDVARWDAKLGKWGEIYSANPTSELVSAINWGLDNLGVAVVSIHSQAFLDARNNADAEKLARLEDVIKYARKQGWVTTYEAWYKYAAAVVIKPPHERKKKTPAFYGGPATIFRMDDGMKGYLEDTVEAIIKVFKQNNVPLDVGVVPHAGGKDSYNMPFLLTYLDEGVIDIHVHGNDHVFLEFDTVRSGWGYEKLDPGQQKCFQDSYGHPTYKPQATNPRVLREGLIRARREYSQYFGFTPVSFTVPYDYYNSEGCLAAQEAGFRVFSSSLLQDPQPPAFMQGKVIMPVDCSGRENKNGMYRLPATSDTAGWNADACAFGDILTLGPATDLNTDMVDALSAGAGVAVLVIHPQAYVDSKNRPDTARLNKLDDIIKYVMANKPVYGPIITFQSWYEWATGVSP